MLSLDDSLSSQRVAGSACASGYVCLSAADQAWLRSLLPLGNSGSAASAAVSRRKRIYEGNSRQSIEYAAGHYARPVGFGCDCGSGVCERAELQRKQHQNRECGGIGPAILLESPGGGATPGHDLRAQAKRDREKQQPVRSVGGRTGHAEKGQAPPPHGIAHERRGLYSSQ